MRLIDADHLNEKMIPNCPIEEGGIPLPDFATHIKILEMYPTVDAVPVVHGRWVKYGHYPPECSVCGGIAPKDCEGEEFYQSDFCQSCGAKMYEGKDNG